MHSHSSALKAAALSAVCLLLVSADVRCSEADAQRFSLALLEERVAILESHPRAVLVDSTGQEVGAAFESGGVIIESEGAFLSARAERQGWQGSGVSTFHLSADCTDAASWLDDFTDPLENSGTLYDFSTVNENRDLFTVDSGSPPVLFWDPIDQGTLPNVYRAGSSGCVADGRIADSAHNQTLTWYLFPLRFVLNLNETFPRLCTSSCDSFFTLRGPGSLRMAISTGA